MQLSKFLRTVLILDAASCLGMAALVLPLGESLAPLLGVEANVLATAATALIPVGLFMLWLGSRRHASAAFVWLVIGGNVSWVASSLIAAASLPAITTMGQLAIAGQGLAVLAITLAEWIGLRASLDANLGAA